MTSKTEENMNSKEQESRAGSEVATGEVPTVIDKKTQRSCLLKFDFIILPMLVVTYIFNSLDRSNLGNAATAGLRTDLGLVGNQYSHLLTMYYAVFVAFGPAMAILSKIISAKYAIPIFMMSFGIASTCSAAATNFATIAVCRIFVGIFESGFYAAVVYYLTIFYTKREIASRISIFYSAVVIASGFGGLIAFGVFHIEDAPLPNWAYLFIIEGSLTCVVAIMSFFVLPKDISSAWFLNKAEIEVALLRIQADNPVQNSWNWSEALSEFKSVHPWIRSALGFVYGILINSSANFLAILTASLGYSVVKTNLYTVAPSFVAATIVIAIAFSSDHFNERGFHMMIGPLLSIIGYSILAGVNITENQGVSYFALFLCTAGAYPMSVIGSAWLVSNVPNTNARAFVEAVMTACNNAAGLVVSNIFRASEAPGYETALIVNASAAGVLLVLIPCYSMYLRYLNRKLDRMDHEGPVNRFDIQREPGFRFQT